MVRMVIGLILIIERGSRELIRNSSVLPRALCLAYHVGDW